MTASYRTVDGNRISVFSTKKPKTHQFIVMYTFLKLTRFEFRFYLFVLAYLFIFNLIYLQLLTKETTTKSHLPAAESPEEFVLMTVKKKTKKNTSSPDKVCKYGDVYVRDDSTLIKSFTETNLCKFNLFCL